MYMPFGKYRGQPVEGLPKPYLKWLLTIDLSDVLKEAVEAALGGRQSRSREKSPPKQSSPVIDLAGWYRRLSMRFHPDRGGSKEAMQAVNAAKQLLEEMLNG